MDVLSPEGLRSLDAPALVAIVDMPGIDETQLSKRLSVDVRRAKRAVKRLEVQGLIERLPSGGRRGDDRLRVTSAGLELRARLLPAGRAAEDRVMAVLSESERRTLHELLARVIKANEVTSADQRDE